MMSTTIVNVKVGHIRPKYADLEVWMEDPGNVYIGRRGVVFVETKKGEIKERFPKKDSIWCNPFKINKDTSREKVIELYEAYIREKLEKSDELKAELLALKGKTLGCWCKPEACHGDVLIRIIHELSE